MRRRGDSERSVSGVMRCAGMAIVVVLGMGAFGAGSVASADDAPEPAKQTEAAEVPAQVKALELIRAYYRTQTVHERVTVTVRTKLQGTEGSDGTPRFASRASTLQLMMRSGAGESAEAREVWIQAGRMRVYGASGAVTVTTDRAKAKWWRATIEGAVSSVSLAKVLRPLPLPQLDFAASESVEGLKDLTRYAREVRWSAATTNARTGVTEITGECRGGKVMLRAESRTGRIREVRVELWRPREVRIEMQVQAVASTGGSGETNGLFAVPSDEASRAATLDEVFAVTGEAAGGAGAQVFACEQLSDVEGESMSCAAFRAERAPDGREARMLSTRVLLFVSLKELKDAGVPREAVERAVAHVGERLAAQDNTTGGACARLVCVYVPSHDGAPSDAGAAESVRDVTGLPSEGTLQEMQAAIDVLRPRLGVLACGSGWVAESEWSKGYLPAGVPGAAVVLDAQLRVQAVVPVLGEDVGGKQFVAELDAAMGVPAPLPAKPE